MGEINSEKKGIEDFLAEAEEITDQLGSELADLADLAERGDIPPELLNSIFRGAHSLKGLAGMFGFREIAELSHNMENLLDSLRLGKIAHDPQLVSVITEACDLLSLLVRNLSDKHLHPETGEQLSECIRKINSCLESHEDAISLPPSPSLSSLGLPDRIVKSLTEYEEHRLLENLKKGKKIYSIHVSFSLETFDEDLSRLSSLLKSAGEVISTLPSAGSNLETNIDFDILYGTTLASDEVAGVTGDIRLSIDLLGKKDDSVPGIAGSAVSSFDGLSSLLSTGEHGGYSAVTQDPHPQAKGDRFSSKSLSSTVRVDIGKLDELMNIVGELVLAHSSISEIAIRMHREGFSRMAVDLGKAAKALERKLTDLRKGVLEIRMIPVGQLYEKMSRIVRKISRELGKKVDIRFLGADTELDKLIIEDITDPMMHIIRNAVDHGIEMPELRLLSGKDEKGLISIGAYQKGNHVIIEIEDDGAGIDIGKIKARALEKNMIQDADSITEKEALEMIFLPGFSTAKSVSETSGRGVGMDVVRNNIQALSGTVDIESVNGSGSRFTITLPITLAIIKALIISCAGRNYAMPITSVLETLLIDRRDITTVERREMLCLRESTLPILRLDNFFRLEHDENGQSEEQFYIVVVGAAEKRVCIVVDDLLGQQDIVIKSLGEAFKRFRGISGAADLGDQRTILVLDVGGIINESFKTGN